MRTFVHVGETLDLQAFRHFEQGGEVFLVHRHFSAVHKLQQGLHLVVSDILQEDNWMLVWSVVEHALEVGGACREDHLVGLQVEPVAGDGDIDEGLMVEEIFKDGEKIVLVVVPAQTVLLRLGSGHRHRGLAPHKGFEGLEKVECGIPGKERQTLGFVFGRDMWDGIYYLHCTINWNGADIVAKQTFDCTL